MPRTMLPVCSGICLLLTTALFGQAPLSPNPKLQQAISYPLPQQLEGPHRLWPPNGARFQYKPGNSATPAFRYTPWTREPATNPTYSFSIKHTYPLYPNYGAALQEQPIFSPLQRYLYRERLYYSSWQQSRQWYEPAHAIGADILRSLIVPPPQRVFQRQKP